MADLPEGLMQECMATLARILGEDVHAVLVLYPDAPVIEGTVEQQEIRVGYTDRDNPDRATVILAGTAASMAEAMGNETRFSIGNRAPAVRVRNRDH